VQALKFEYRTLFQRVSLTGAAFEVGFTSSSISFGLLLRPNWLRLIVAGWAVLVFFVFDFSDRFCAAAFGPLSRRLRTVRPAWRLALPSRGA